MVKTLAQRSLQSVWHPCTQMWQADRDPPLAVARAQGAWLILETGERLFDGISSWWVNLLGHGHPRVVSALKDQLDTLSHVMLAGFTHEPAVQLAEALSERTHGQLGHCFFASDGASAVEIALKMSAHRMREQGRPERNRFICLAQSYHGETLGALSVTDVPLFREAYAPLLRPPLIAPSPDPRLAPPGLGAEAWAEQAARALERMVEAHQHEVCALILEPLVQAAAGMGIYSSHYLRRARAITQAYDIDLIADEIAVGCGRTGRFFAFEHAIESPSNALEWPDLICLSKGISGGFLPLSLVLVKPSIYKSFYHPEPRRGFLHSHSYSGNPLACRAAVEVLRVMAEEQILEQTERAGRRVSEVLSAHLQPALADGRLQHLRAIGSIWAVDLPATPSRGEQVQSIRAGARARGLFLRPIGGTLYLMPPLVLHEGHAEWLATTFAQAVLGGLHTHAAGPTPPALP